ncbi:MAG: PaaI family thioesterase [Syntrophobacteraceae bacterium]
MDDKIKQTFCSQVEGEPFARKFGLKLVDISKGYSRVEMTLTPEMENMLGMTHGGALFALLDEAFETASNSHGTLSVALNMNVTFIAPARPGSTLTAEAREISLTRKTASYEIKVRDESGVLIVTCQALVYRKGTTLPFLEGK